MKPWHIAVLVVTILVAAAGISFAIVFAPVIQIAVATAPARQLEARRQKIEQRAYDLAKVWYQGHMYNWDGIRRHYVNMALIEAADGCVPASEDPRLNQPLPEWIRDRAFTLDEYTSFGRHEVRYRGCWQ